MCRHVLSDATSARHPRNHPDPAITSKLTELLNVHVPHAQGCKRPGIRRAPPLPGSDGRPRRLADGPPLHWAADGGPGADPVSAAAAPSSSAAVFRFLPCAGGRFGRAGLAVRAFRFGMLSTLASFTSELVSSESGKTAGCPAWPCAALGCGLTVLLLSALPSSGPRTQPNGSTLQADSITLSTRRSSTASVNVHAVPTLSGAGTQI